MYFHYVLSKDNNVKYAFNVVQYYYCTNNFLCFVKHFHVNVSKKNSCYKLLFDKVSHNQVILKDL